jgi:hypothetical protein
LRVKFSATAAAARAASGPAKALLRWIEAACAGLLLWSCFLPWLSVMGTPVAAHRIREQLEGPHRFVSFFARDSRISFDYSISLWLRVLPFAAAAVLLASLWQRARRPSLPGAALQVSGGVLCGLGALIAYLYLRSEAGDWPFVHLAYGSRLAALTGAALAAASSLRLAALFRR